ncbi:MAG: hypothetical protein ACOC29_01570 [Candidatus Sumerlaeota bacterium]
MTKKQNKEEEKEPKKEKGVYSPIGQAESESIKDGSIERVAKHGELEIEIGSIDGETVA